MLPKLVSIKMLVITAARLDATFAALEGIVFCSADRSPFTDNGAAILSSAQGVNEGPKCGATASHCTAP